MRGTCTRRVPGAVIGIHPIPGLQSVGCEEVAHVLIAACHPRLTIPIVRRARLQRAVVLVVHRAALLPTGHLILAQAQCARCAVVHHQGCGACALLRWLLNSGRVPVSRGCLCAHGESKASCSEQYENGLHGCWVLLGSTILLLIPSQAFRRHGSHRNQRANSPFRGCSAHALSHFKPIRVEQ